MNTIELKRINNKAKSDAELNRKISSIFEKLHLQYKYN